LISRVEALPAPPRLIDRDAADGCLGLLLDLALLVVGAAPPGADPSVLGDRLLEGIHRLDLDRVLVTERRRLLQKSVLDILQPLNRSGVDRVDRDTELFPLLAGTIPTGEDDRVLLDVLRSDLDTEGDPTHF